MSLCSVFIAMAIDGKTSTYTVTDNCLLSIRLSGLLQHDCVEAVYLAGVAQAIADGVGVQVDAARRLPEIVNVVESRAAGRCD